MNTRQRILNRLRMASPTATGAPPAPIAEAERADTATLVQRFKACMEAVHGEVVIASAPTWPGELAAILRRKGVRRLLIDPSEDHGVALLAALAEVEAVPFARPIEDWKTELFETIDAGFTVAESAIAATGTLVFSSGPRTPRTASLVPPLHVAVLHATRLHADLRAAMTKDRWSAHVPTNRILVSGPSKTSDIQQTLAYGAHGPKEVLTVIVLADPGSVP